jgi:hypothetical protein
MIRICCWCGELLGEKPPYESREITGTICDRCKDKMSRELGEENNGGKNAKRS